MLSSRDEIMLKLAANLPPDEEENLPLADPKDVIYISPDRIITDPDKYYDPESTEAISVEPQPVVSDEPEVTEQEKEEEKPGIFHDVPTDYEDRLQAIPGQNVNLDISSFNLDRNKKAALIAAMRDPKSYFKRVYYYLSSREDLDPVTGWLLDNIVTEKPLEYFNIDLNRQRIAGRWLQPAYKSLLQKNPGAVIGQGLFRFPELAKFQPEMWETTWENEFARAGEGTGKMFEGDLTTISQLNKLAFRLSNSHPEYFLKNVHTRMRDLVENNIVAGYYSKQIGGNLLRKLDTARENAQRHLKHEESKMGSDMLQRLIKVANILDKAGEYDLASNIDSIIRHAVSATRMYEEAESPSDEDFRILKLRLPKILQTLEGLARKHQSGESLGDKELSVFAQYVEMLGELRMGYVDRGLMESKEAEDVSLQHDHYAFIYDHDLTDEGEKEDKLMQDVKEKREEEERITYEPQHGQWDIGSEYGEEEEEEADPEELNFYK